MGEYLILIFGKRDERWVLAFAKVPFDNVAFGRLLRHNRNRESPFLGAGEESLRLLLASDEAKKMIAVSHSWNHMVCRAMGENGHLHSPLESLLFEFLSNIVEQYYLFTYAEMGQRMIQWVYVLRKHNFRCQLIRVQVVTEYGKLKTLKLL